MDPLTACRELEPAFAERLLAASIYLHRERHALQGADSLFHQGRTLGLVNCDAPAMRKHIARFPCGRFLVHATRRNIDPITRSLEHAGLRVETGLITLTAEVATVRERVAELEETTNGLSGTAEVLDIGTSEDVIRQVQTLQTRRGLAPMPAWFLRGDAISSLSLAWRDDAGQVIATGVAQCLPTLGRWLRPVLASGICVRDRGRGLGKHVNAALLSLAIERFAADGLVEIVEFGNHASLRINAATGLKHDPATIFLYAETPEVLYGDTSN